MYYSYNFASNFNNFQTNTTKSTEMKGFKRLLVLGILFSGSFTYAQNKITGVIYDATSKTAIEGAEIVIKGTANGTYSESEGTFTLTTELNQGQAQVSLLGYLTKTVNFSTNGTNEMNLGTIYINEDEQSLDEIVVMARGVIDVAQGRRTPIASSTVTKQQIEEKVGAQDITSTLVNTPSVYVTSQARGFGESSMTTRGFDQSNTAFLLNGQPINGMDNGSVYWSNWSGMSDIANAIQIQRGLGSSKLAISSVGGTINFITKATEMKEGGFVKATYGNDNFIKTTVGYNTGLLKNGWGVSAMITQWQGDGYTDQTAGEGQNYFFSVGYKPNDNHNFNFLITGAPQWHNQGTSTELSNYVDYGRKFNANAGYLNGEAFNGRKNYYHKPVANLNWDWKIDEKSNLSTVLYASIARGGGQANRYAVDRNTETGYLDYDSAVDKNLASPDGKAVNWLGADVNNHKWFGIVSNYNRDLTDNLSFNVGFDLRTYKGSHQRQVTNLLGAEYVQDSGNINLGTVKITDTFSTNPWKAMTDFAKNPDQIYGWIYDQTIRYGGVFAQLEYATDKFSAFFQGSASQQSNERTDSYQYTPGNEKSEKVSNFGYNVKGGVSYNINNEHFFFANAGIYSRQPYQNNIFMNYKNDVNPYAVNEDIVGLELGYKFTSEFIDINLNAYKTTWENRVTGSSKMANAADVTKYNPTADPSILNEGEYIYTSNYGTKQDHKGLELDFVARPLYNLEIRGFASVGDWKYRKSANTVVRNEARVVLEEKSTYLDGAKVGDAAQTVLGLGFKYKIIANLSVDADYRYYDDLYSSRQQLDNLQLPSYQLFDAGVSYALDFNAKNRLSFRVNVNNLLDTKYISQLSTATHRTEASETFKGIDTTNQGLMGWGRTWSVSAKFTF